jgi:peptidyl-prolyl cis-trans isomerase C
MSYEELLQHEVRTWSPEDTADKPEAGAAIASGSLIASDTATPDDDKQPDRNVTVNDIEISAREINIESANYEGGTILERQYQAAVALVVRELLLQRATQLELHETGDDLDKEGLIDQVLEQEVTLPQTDEDACRRYFDNHQDKFRSADLFEVSHILIAADPRDDDARVVAKEQARAAIQLLAGDASHFAELASELSDCPSKNTGGNMGQVGKGQTVSEFEDVLFRMQEGELSSSPVESRYGFHIIHLQRRIDGTPLEYDIVRDQIAIYLRDSVHRSAMGQYLRILAGRAEISGIDLEGSETPLVQ